MQWECSECGVVIEGTRQHAVCPECGTAGALVGQQRDLDTSISRDSRRDAWLRLGMQLRKPLFDATST
jgi:hypothetical protein